jgi:tetratricopeptide (TPR) repeat protein
VRHARLLLLGFLAAGLAAGGALGDPPAQKAPTIGDLKGRAVEVRPDSASDPGAARARDNYEKFLNLDGGDSSLRSEAMRRLGDLKLEAGELNRIEQELSQGSPLDTRDAIVLYTRLLAIYPNYERNDAVLYQLARAYEADQQVDKALATLEQMVARYPSSRYVDEAQFRRGEILFIQRQWPQAESAYAAVIAFGPRSEFYEQGLYKHGWARFKHGDTEGGLDSFATLLDRKLLDAGGHERDLETFTRPQRELVEDTLRVCAISFSFDDDAKGVDHFLERHGPKAYAHLLYATLGDLYMTKERWTDAADAYRAFAKREPDHEKSPLLQMQAISAYKRGGFASLVLDGKREYVERYGLGASFWAHRRPADAPLVVQELKTNVQDLAAYYHEQAQATKQIGDYQEAARWYRAFLTSFPDDNGSAATNYRLADALFESHQYGEAAVEYEHTAYGHAPDAHSAVAGYAALVAYDKHEPELAGDARRDWHRAALESGLRFATTFQDHPESVTVLVRTAREMFDAKEYGKAADVADIVLARRPAVDADKQRTAWTVIANSQFELGQFDRAEGAYLQVQSLLAAGDAQRPAIDERLAAAVYKQGEAKRAAGDDAGAIEDFLRVAKLTPGAKIRATADYDAAALLIGRKDWPRAIAVLEGFRRMFPASDLQPEVTRKLAVAYSEADRPGVAAPEFERIATAAGTAPDLQREALAQAAVLYEKAGDVPRTTAALESYLKRFPAPFDAAVEARQKLADLAARRGDAARRAALLDEIVRADQAAGAARTDRSRYLAAKASLELALPTRDAFNAVKLVLPLKKSLDAKRSAMQRALKAFEGADAYSIAEVSTAATFEMAELYRRLAEDLLKSERPKALKGEGLEQYDLLLEEQAYPFEEQAIAIHVVNAGRAAHGIYDESVHASFATLAKLKPARFGKTEDHEEFAIAIGGDPVAGARTAPLAVSVRFQEAVAAGQAGNLARAEQEFAALTASEPTLAGPPLNLGIARARAGRWAEAEQALNEALRRNGSAVAASDELGIVLRNLGRFGDASAAYQKALAADPQSPRVHRNAGVLEDLYLGHAAEALAHFEQALAAGADEKPVAGWAAELRQRLASAQKTTAAEAP